MGALMPSHDFTPRPNTGGVSQEFHHHSVSNVVISVTVLGLTWVVKLWEKHNCESLRFANTINNLKFRDKFGARWFGTSGRMMFLFSKLSNGDYIHHCLLGVHLIAPSPWWKSMQTDPQWKTAMDWAGPFCTETEPAQIGNIPVIGFFFSMEMFPGYNHHYYNGAEYICPFTFQSPRVFVKSPAVRRLSSPFDL